jgi:putative flippase GtrA
MSPKNRPQPIFLTLQAAGITAFFLSKKFVFLTETRHGSRQQFLRFAPVNVFAAAQVWGISIGWADYVFPALDMSYLRHDLAHLIGVVFPVFTSFLGHKYFSFRAKAGP